MYSLYTCTLLVLVGITYKYIQWRQYIYLPMTTVIDDFSRYGVPFVILQLDNIKTILGLW